MPQQSTPHNFQSYIVDQPDTQVFTVDRDLFRDPALFELEMKYIFEGTWIYLAHESQLPRPHDFFTTVIGRQPVILTRNKDGEIGGFLNTCPHRGATLCQTRRGHQQILTCPYHGWAFNTNGENVNVKDYPGGAYTEGFDRLNHDLTRIPRLSLYRGFIFGSLNPAVPDLADHLGETRAFIDLLVDQAPNGLEVVRGSTDYTYAGNWKLQIENGVDGYHFDTLHRSFMGVIRRRMASGKDAVKAINVDGLMQQSIAQGCYDLANGHTLIWFDLPNPQDRPLYAQRSRLAAELGEARTHWMIDRLRNLLVYPNVFFMDQTSTQMRVIQPLAVDKTKVSTCCIAPRGESAEARERRLRQYEDFFNASGVGTPDDLAVFEACQRGYKSSLVRWQQGYFRGMGRMLLGGDEHAQALGVRPYSTSGDARDETLYHGQYRQWLKLMSQGQSADKGGRNGW